MRQYYQITEPRTLIQRIYLSSMKKQTQEAWVLSQLIKNSKISRNKCLKNYISRLSAIIPRIVERTGVEIEGRWVITKNGRDYVYFLK